METPGSLIEEEMAERGWNKIDLAAAMGVGLGVPEGLINRNDHIGAYTATYLAKAFGTSPEFWLNLETQYQAWLLTEIRAGSDDHIAKPGKIVPR